MSTGPYYPRILRLKFSPPNFLKHSQTSIIRGPHFFAVFSPKIYSKYRG